MQLKILQAQLAAYRDFLRKPQAWNGLYPWESQRIFQEQWDLEAVDLAAMYERSLENSSTRRMWNRENYEPKRLMLDFLKMEPEFIRSMFRELFNEDKSPEFRVDRFVFYCDELLQTFRRRNRNSVENNHYHGDYQMPFLYLAFRFPERYTLYDFNAWRRTLEKLGTPQLPETHDPGRYIKLARTINGFIQKDAELLQNHHARLDPAKHFMGESLLLVYDFYQWCAGNGK